MQNESNLLLVQIMFCLEYYLPIGWFYLMKKSAKVLFYFGLDCGMLEFFKYCTDGQSSKEQLFTYSPAFLEHGFAEKMAV
jgi:hypothetical protein